MTIEKLRIEKLFGTYDYLLPSDKEMSLGKMSFLYGDNGCGKTTILRLLFHTLATADKSGHKTYVARIKFKIFSITLINDVEIFVEKVDDLIGDFNMTILEKGIETANFSFHVDNEGAVPGTLANEHEYVEFINKLKKLQVNLYFLTDMRNLLIDNATNNSMKKNKYYGRIEEDLDDLLETKRSYSKRLDSEYLNKKLLIDSLNRATSFFKELSIKDSVRSELNVNSLYGEILDRAIINTVEENDKIEITKPVLKERLESIEEKSKEFAAYGILPVFNVRKIYKSVGETSPEKFLLLKQILIPYLDSLDSKYETLSSLKTRIKTFIDLLNSFYTNKKIHFHLRKGLTIKSKDGETLTPEVLSSGERQILLLFCNTLISINYSSVVIIDEPELSLNIKWQRKLINALDELTKDSKTQFLFATHNFEILSNKIDDVIKLS